MVKVNVEFSANYDDLVNIINDLHDREKCLDDLDKTYPIVELLLSRACFEYEEIQPFLDKVSNYMRHKYDGWIEPRDTFADLYRRGKVNESDIDDFIEGWHSGDGSDLELHDYLGLTKEQYRSYVVDGKLDL